MLRFLFFLVIIFAVYVVFYGTPAVAAIDNSLPASMHEPMENLHQEAMNSIAQAIAQGRASLGGLGQAIADAFHR